VGFGLELGGFGLELGGFGLELGGFGLELGSAGGAPEQERDRQDEHTGHGDPDAGTGEVGQ
jgi:hypothetical protein